MNKFFYCTSIFENIFLTFNLRNVTFILSYGVTNLQICILKLPQKMGRKDIYKCSVVFMLSLCNSQIDIYLHIFQIIRRFGLAVMINPN